MAIDESFLPYEKSDVVEDKRYFAVVVSPGNVGFDSRKNIVGALGGDNRTFVYLKHQTVGHIKIPQFAEPLLPGSLKCDSEGNPVSGITKDGRVLFIDGRVEGESSLPQLPDLGAQDYVEINGRRFRLEMPVYSSTLGFRDNWLPFHALGVDNQTVFTFREVPSVFYVIPEDCLEKLLSKPRSK